MIEEGHIHDHQWIVNMDIEIRTFLKLFSTDHNTVVIPTDKTNGYKTVPLAGYIWWVEPHLGRDARVIERNQLEAVLQEATELAKRYQKFLSRGEFLYLWNTVSSRPLPNPCLLI